MSGQLEVGHLSACKQVRGWPTLQCQGWLFPGGVCQAGSREDKLTVLAAQAEPEWPCEGQTSVLLTQNTICPQHRIRPRWSQSQPPHKSVRPPSCFLNSPSISRVHRHPPPPTNPAPYDTGKKMKPLGLGHTCMEAPNFSLQRLHTSAHRLLGM